MAALQLIAIGGYGYLSMLIGGEVHQLNVSGVCTIGCVISCTARCTTSSATRKRTWLASYKLCVRGSVNSLILPTGSLERVAAWGACVTCQGSAPVRTIATRNLLGILQPLQHIMFENGITIAPCPGRGLHVTELRRARLEPKRTPL